MKVSLRFLTSVPLFHHHSFRQSLNMNDISTHSPGEGGLVRVDSKLDLHDAEKDGSHTFAENAPATPWSTTIPVHTQSKDESTLNITELPEEKVTTAKKNDLDGERPELLTNGELGSSLPTPQLEVKLSGLPAFETGSDEEAETRVASTSQSITNIKDTTDAPVLVDEKKYEVSKVKALLVDLGDVLCNWTAPESLPIAPAMLHRFRKSHFWYKHDMGLLSQDECYANLATQYSVSSSDISEAFKRARDSLKPNETVFALLRGLKSRYGASFKIYLMSNIPALEWESMRARTEYEWPLFDGFYTSSQAGMCKPELRFFRHVLQEIGSKPSEVVLVDDNAENILAARSLGIKSLRFQNADGLAQFFNNIFQSPSERGMEYLHKHAKNMWSITTTGREVRDNFAQLFTYEAVRDL
jgi:FMN phosphatase YigB (HAD superfamily)